MIVDLSMPELGGLEAARELKKRHIPGCVIFLTVHEDASFVEEAQAVGAMGYVLKSSADRDLVPAIREALEKLRRSLRTWSRCALKCFLLWQGPAGEANLVAVAAFHEETTHIENRKGAA